MMLSSTILMSVLPLALAASSTSSTSMGSGNTMSMSTSSTDSADATPTDTSPPYTITALPAVKKAAACVFNCLIPIGLADPSGCDEVTENCACLSAPADALSALTECVATVCQSSTLEYQTSVTNLYQSYCESIYGTVSFEAAITSNVQADAIAASSASAASVEATETTTSTAPASTTSKTSHGDLSVPGSQASLLTGGLAISILLFAALF